MHVDRSEDSNDAGAPVFAARYDPVAKSLHWVVFALVFIQFIIAWTMPAIRRGVVPGRLINLHLSFGVLIMTLVVIRALWRRACEQEDEQPAHYESCFAARFLCFLRSGREIASLSSSPRYSQCHASPGTVR